MKGCQKEGNGNIHMVLRSRWLRLILYIRNASSLNERHGISPKAKAGIISTGWTHPKDSWVIGHLLLRLLRLLLNPQIFDITPTEHDVLVDIVACRHETLGARRMSLFGTKGFDVLQCNSRVLRRYFMQSPNITERPPRVRASPGDAAMSEE